MPLQYVQCTGFISKSEINVLAQEYLGFGKKLNAVDRMSLKLSARLSGN